MCRIPHTAIHVWVKRAFAKSLRRVTVKRKVSAVHDRESQAMKKSISRPAVTALAFVTAGVGVTTGCSNLNAVSQRANDVATSVAGVSRDDSTEKWVVGLGDSYMSGEAGQWATNSNAMTTNGGWQVGTVDEIYGSTAGSSNSIYRGCHRADSAPMNLGGDWKFKNLACSGATSATVASDKKNQYFKPGIDFEEVPVSDGQSGFGQAHQLQEFAKQHNVDVVTVSIGGNDAGFADVVTNCAKAFLLATPTSDYCRDEKAQQERVTPEAKEALTAKVARALTNVSTAMSNAGYSPDDYRIVYQLPPAPVPAGQDMRWGETYARALVGGCGFYNKDIAWLQKTYDPLLREAMTEGARRAASSGSQPDVRIVDNVDLFDGHRLCELNSTRADGIGNPPPLSTQAGTEWVRNISIADLKLRSDKDALTEPMHPMYWGQRALAACNRAAAQAPDGTAPRTYTCTLNSNKTTDDGEPSVTLTEH